MRWKEMMLLGVAVLLFTACHPRISTDIGEAGSNAERLLSKLYKQNNELETFKGIGEIRLWNARGARTARIAWLAKVDGSRLRAEILGPSGRPLMKLAYDGRRFYFYSVTDEGVRQRRIRNPSLERAVEVPLTIRELILFLAGRFPVYEHGEVKLAVSSGPQEPDRLVLTGDWSGLKQQLNLTPDHDAVKSLSIYDRGDLRYHAELAEYRLLDGFLIPSRVRVSNGAAAGFEIRIARFWPNVAVRAQQFTISAP